MSNQKGISLVEVLVVIVLLSVVGMLIMNVIIQAQNTYKQQQVTNKTTTEMSFMINSITRDIRQYPEDISIVNNVITISPGNETPIVYKFDSSQLLLQRNNQSIVSKVSNFSATFKNGLIELELKDSSEKVWKSTIVIRTGGDL